MGNPVVHFDVGCSNSEESRDFYQTVFDWIAEPYGPFSFKFDTGSSRGIQGYTTALGHEPHQYVMFYVEVEDITAKSKLVEAQGGQIVVPETQVPESGAFAWCKDPAGNLFGLWKPQNEVA
jgi:predicted enzyme related to lactoylglutathione lyase